MNANTIVKKLLGEDDPNEPYHGVVFDTVDVRKTGEAIVLSFAGHPSTYVMGISSEAAAKLVTDLQAIAAGNVPPPASSASAAPAGTPPGPSTA